MIGNSSSGIIESASFGVACINIGDRQRGRFRNENVVDCPQVSMDAFAEAFDRALNLHPPFVNQYGDGKTSERITAILPKLRLTAEVLSKYNSY